MPHSLFLEEDVAKNAEFPDSEGLFHLSRGLAVRYRVCGDPYVESETSGSSPATQHLQSQEMPVPVTQPWSIPRHWTAVAQRGRMTQQPLTAEKKHSPAVPTVYKVFYKRTLLR